MKHFGTFFAVLLAFIGIMEVAAQEPYAVVSSDNSSLTFYYDNQKASRPGTKYDIPWSGEPGWYANRSTITTATFDASFADYHGLTSTAYMFYYLTNLTQINNLDYLNTENVTSMANMFENCATLRSLDLTSFNTQKVTNMYNMFYYCGWLTTIYCNNSWNRSGLTSTNMFKGCSGLRGGNGTTFSASYLDATYARVDAAGTPGYFTAKAAEPYAALSTDGSTLTFYYDNRKAIRTGTKYDIPWSGKPGWYDSNGNTTIQTVTFDWTFDNYHGLTSAYYMFANLRALSTINNLEYLNTENVVNMNSMFSNCSSLTTLNLYSFNTENVFHMGSMFKKCSSLRSLNVSSFNTAKVEIMYALFQGCSSLTSLNLSNFNTAKVTNMSEMFNLCTNLVSLNVSNFNTAKVTDMSYMFNGCSSLTSLDVSNFNTESVTYMYIMFRNCSSLTSLDVSNFNTAEVTNMESMFDNCYLLTSLDVSNFNTSKVTNMNYMFRDCRGLEKIYCLSDWGSGIVNNSTDMFKDCLNLTGGNGTTYNASEVTVSYAHLDAADNPGYFTTKPAEPYAVVSADDATLTFYFDNQKMFREGTKYDIPWSSQPGWYEKRSTITTATFDASFADYHELTNAAYMFYYLTNLTQINGLYFLNTENVTSMQDMFENCASLTSLDVSRFNIAKVTTMYDMFFGCSQLTTLDLSSFNTAKVTNMYKMFYNCSSLRTIFASGDWNKTTVNNSNDMFNGCTNLKGGNGTTYNANNVTVTYAHPDATGNAGYFTFKPASGGLRGDVNGDGQVTIADVTALVNIILGKE